MDINDIKAKVRKLLALARGKGATEAEAALAAERAQALLEEHKLSSADVVFEEQRETTGQEQMPGAHRAPGWKRLLIRAVCDTGHCFVVRDVNANVYQLFGKPTDIAVARELYEFLCEQVDYLARQLPAGDRTYRNSFRLGCASRVGTRLREAFNERKKAAASNERALAIYDDGRAATALAHATFKHLRHNPVRGGRDSSGYAAGQRAGDSVRIGLERKVGHRPVGLIG